MTRAAQPAAIAPSSQPDLQLLARLFIAQHVALAIVGLIAIVVLCGWLVPAFGSALAAGWSLMKANTALAFLFSALSLTLMLQQKPTERRIILGRVCAATVVLLAGTALFGHLSGRSLWLETVLAANSGATLPGRISVQTARFLVLSGGILLLEGRPRKQWQQISDALTLLLLAMVLVIIAAYFFGAEHLFGQSFDTRTSPHTLVCMVLMGFALVVRRTELGFFSVLIGIGIGSQICRKSVAFVLLVPFLIILGASYMTINNWLPAPYPGLLSAVSISALLFLFVLAIGRKINNLERDLRDMSLDDELTGIHNRRGFSLIGEYALRQARRAGAPVTVLYFDLDGLKRVNDTLGHDVGSQLIVDFATLLRTSFRASDVVARVGGDEFAVVTSNGLGHSLAALQRLAGATGAANSRGKPYRVSYSVGEATGEPAGSEKFAEIVDRADRLMYQRKRLKEPGNAQRPEPPSPADLGVGAA
ncbi:MAG TPA: GGDEF domain-containing protein [Stellaceae bacterium]|nr:GGDEF domain-containing protein [Stellaceae bacterium]